jgi:hypothetical protein
MPLCLQAISSDDTLYFDGKEVVHLNCGRPRQLGYEERVLLLKGSARLLHVAARKAVERRRYLGGLHSDPRLRLRRPESREPAKSCR